MTREMKFKSYVHDEDPDVCKRFDCTPTSDAPEFEIETRYATGSQTIKPGWKYSLRWGPITAKNFEHGYGYATRGSAKNAAETTAKAIALANRAPEVYTFTPEL